MTIGFVSRLMTAGALLAMPANPAGAQNAPTAITPNGGARALGTTVVRTGTTATIDGGTLVGPNLFHSFNTFTLAAGDTARWVHRASDPSPITAVINRVTGGNPSTIAGTIDSIAIPNASFYFINPAGVTFTAGAQVNVPAAAFFSTAQSIVFADGISFSISTPGGSTLSVATPESFGFVGSERNVVVRGVGSNFADPALRLGFSGAEVVVRDSAFEARRIDLVGVGTKARHISILAPAGGGSDWGNVTVRESDIRVTGSTRLVGSDVLLNAGSLIGEDSTARTGGPITVNSDTLTLSNGALLGTRSVGGSGGGDVTVRTGTLTMKADAKLFARTISSGNAGNLNIAADVINLNSAQIDTDSAERVRGNAGNITITANNIQVDNSEIRSQTQTGSRGVAGNISIVTQDAVFRNGSRLASATQGSGPGGTLFLKADTVLLNNSNLASNARSSGSGGAVIVEAGSFTATNDSRIASNTFGSGDAGRIVLRLGSGIIDENTQISAQSTEGATGKGGNIDITTDGSFIIRDFGRVTAATFGTADAGTIAITAGLFRVNGNGSAVENSTFGAGSAGRVTVRANSLQVINSGKIASQVDESASGNGGVIDIAAGTIEVINKGTITGATRGTGRSGEIRIDADTLLIDGAGSALLSSTERRATGNASALTVEANAITVRGGGRIAASTVGPGSAGTISLSSDTLLIERGGTVTSSTSGAGAAGSIVIAAADLRVANPSASITSSTNAAGVGGSVTIGAGTLSVTDGARIASQVGAGATGTGGTVTITADDLHLQSGGAISVSTFGVGDAGTAVLAARTAIVETGASIQSSTEGAATGNAGNLNFSTETLSLRTGGQLTASTSGVGAAGNISVIAQNTSLEANSSVSSLSLGSGRGGTVRIVSDTLDVSGGTITTASLATGNAGDIRLSGDTLSFDGAVVTSDASGPVSGGSGSVTIEGNTIEIFGGTSIATSSTNPSAAGAVSIAAPTVSISGAGTSIESTNSALAGGPAGSARIAARLLQISEGATVTTNSAAGPAGDITLALPFTALAIQGAAAADPLAALDNQGLVILRGRTLPVTITTSSGPRTGGTITIAQPLAVISDGASILALGDAGGARVRIVAPVFIRSSDRVNTLSVSGTLLLDTAISDVSNATASIDLSLVDASKVLRGQCPQTRSTGQVSQLTFPMVGPYAPKRNTILSDQVAAVETLESPCL